MSDPQHAQALVDYVRHQLDVTNITLRDYQRLSGGAIQDNYALTLDCVDGMQSATLELVVRSDAPSQVDVSLSRAQEFQILKTAFQAGVTVPEPLWLCTDKTIIGSDFIIMRRVKGQAGGRELVRTTRSVQQMRDLTRSLGQELARLHRVRPPVDTLSFLPVPNKAPALCRVDTYRAALDALPDPHPVLEFALAWLEKNAPSSHDVVLCHCDFRTGNYMVHNHQISGVLDWEFATWSDPYEDLGWLCAKSWRFGVNDRAVGGVGHKADLFSGYDSVSGYMPKDDTVLYWEVMGMTRWAIIALQQAQRHISGRETSLELALTGRLLPEIEFDLLNQIKLLGGAS